MQLASVLLPALIATATGPALEWVSVAPDRRSFTLQPSGSKFTPWGFNYDHDDRGRLIEDYWDAEWALVEKAFRDMKQLGANVVRIHLQLGKFMKSQDQPNAKSLARLERLVKLAEDTGIYLDLTGLGCYQKKDVPAWYDDLGEINRWKVQARFWEAVADRCKKSPAVFCYDLMNEPVVPGGRRAPRHWLGPPFGDKHFVQFITLDQANRPRADIAVQWVKGLRTAIHKHDTRHLITVGLVSWSLDRPGLTSGFVPGRISPEVDFVSVHLYPEQGKVAEALKTLDGFAVGKPVVIEETFPLQCSIDEFSRFMHESESRAAGWLGFFWGPMPEDYRRSNTIAAAMTRQWLEFFRSHPKK
jgi:hypothetical protein